MEWFQGRCIEGSTHPNQELVFSCSLYRTDGLNLAILQQVIIKTADKSLSSLFAAFLKPPAASAALFVNLLNGS